MRGQNHQGKRLLVFCFGSGWPVRHISAKLVAMRTLSVGALPFQLPLECCNLSKRFIASDFQSSWPNSLRPLRWPARSRLRPAKRHRAQGCHCRQITSICRTSQRRREHHGREESHREALPHEVPKRPTEKLNHIVQHDFVPFGVRRPEPPLFKTRQVKLRACRTNQCDLKSGDSGRSTAKWGGALRTCS